MFSEQEIADYKEWLLARKESKQAIIMAGGEQALSHSSKDISRIMFALKRIENGQFGLCTNCGTPIDKKRLDKIPETPFCVDCMTAISN